MLNVMDLMAKGKKTGGKNFELGNTYGQGRPILPLDLKGVKPLSEDVYKRMYTKYLEMPLSDLTARIEEKTLPALEHLFAASIKAAIDTGNLPGLRDGFDRTLGKVKDSLEVTMPKPLVIRRLNGDEIVLTAALPKEDGSDE